jgi:hypothetical protein
MIINPITMQHLIIESTGATPQVLFKSNGNLSLKGRSMAPDIVLFYRPLNEWVSRLNAPKVRFSIDLDYFNTASSKILFELMKVIDNNANIREFDVLWHFETDDEDILEKGQLFEEKLKKAKFIYTSYAGVCNIR